MIINIDDLTLGQIKQISALTSGNINATQQVASSIYSRYIGKYVIIRSRNEGINAGFVKEADSTGIVLSEARRIYYHCPKDKNMSWYEGVAESGLSDDSKISIPIEEKAIIEDYSITLCSDKGKKSISGFKSHGQS